MVSKWVLVGLLVGLASAEDLSSGGDGTNMEFSTGYSAQGTADMRLRPSGVFYAYGGGKWANTQAEKQNEEQQLQQYGQGRTLGLMSSISNSLGLGEGRSLAYMGGGAALGVAAYYLYSIMNLSGAKKALEKIAGVSPKKKASEKKDMEKKSETSEDKATTRRRRRRAIGLEDDEMELATLYAIVRNAIQSGECLQKTVCLVGKQVTSTKRAKFAEAMLSAIVPESIQKNVYYGILVRSLKGELDCDAFSCSNIYKR